VKIREKEDVLTVRWTAATNPRNHFSWDSTMSPIGPKKIQIGIRLTFSADGKYVYVMHEGVMKPKFRDHLSWIGLSVLSCGRYLIGLHVTLTTVYYSAFINIVLPLRHLTLFEFRKYFPFHRPNISDFWEDTKVRKLLVGEVIEQKLKPIGLRWNRQRLLWDAMPQALYLLSA